MDYGDERQRHLAMLQSAIEDLTRDPAVRPSITVAQLIDYMHKVDDEELTAIDVRRLWPSLPFAARSRVSDGACPVPTAATDAPTKQPLRAIHSATEEHPACRFTATLQLTLEFADNDVHVVRTLVRE